MNIIGKWRKRGKMRRELSNLEEHPLSSVENLKEWVDKWRDVMSDSEKRRLIDIVIRRLNCYKIMLPKEVE